jgi:carotenoid cleavage dioxygenase-like enzyme
VRLLARFVETYKHRTEREAGKYLHPAFGTNFRDVRIPKHQNDINTANTSVLPLGDPRFR